MPSDRQIAANRANALRSTGPRTEAGKAASRRNALDHGLRAEELLLDGEDPALFEAMRTELLAEFEPEGSLEHIYAERLVMLFWRLGRQLAFEPALLTWIGHRQTEVHDSSHSFKRQSPSPDHPAGRAPRSSQRRADHVLDFDWGECWVRLSRPTSLLS